MDHTIDIAVADGSFPAHVARPEPGNGPAPVVVVVQEIFGVNAGIRGSTRRS